MSAPTTSSPRHQLPRTRRLHGSAAFATARQLGRRIVAKCFIMNWLESSGAPFSRLGVVTSRKVGPAVVRNRVRRLLREVFRKHQQALPRPVDLVLVARPSITGWRLPEIEREYLTVLRRNALLARDP